MPPDMRRLGILLILAGVLGVAAISHAEEPTPPSKGQKVYEEAAALMEKGDFDGAIPDLEKAVKLDKDFAPAYYALAVCHARKKEPDTAAARHWHQKAVALGYQFNEWLDQYCNQLDKQTIKAP